MGVAPMPPKAIVRSLIRRVAVWTLVGTAALAGSSQGGEPRARTILEYTARGRIEPSDVPGLGFVAAKTGTATFPPGEAGPLRTSDSNTAADGKYYFLRPGTLDIDPEQDVRLEVTVRVPRSSGHLAATAVQLPVESGKPGLGPFRLGGMGEAYQDVVSRHERWVGLGFATHATDRDKDEVVLLDLGGGAGGRVLGRLQLPLNVMRTYVLEVVRSGPRREEDLIRLSVEGLSLKPVTARRHDLQPYDMPQGYGLLFGHPAGAGLGEAEWQRLALTYVRTSDVPGRLAPPADLPRQIGGRRQLFVDDWLIEAMHGLKREQGQPVKHAQNPVFRRQNAWEAARCELYGSAVWDPEHRRLQLFYSAMSKPYDTKLAYAESQDGGTHWSRPPLEAFRFEGKPTNIIWPGRYFVSGPCVFRDPHDPVPARRYKLFTADVVVGNVPRDKGREGIDVGFSPDGLHWTPSAKNPVMPGFNSDTAQSVFWDPVRRKYVAYVRVRTQFGRSVGLTESDDFETWTEPRAVYWPTAEDQKQGWQFYSHSVAPYEGMYLALVWIFPATAASADWKADTPVTWPELAVSRNGTDWQRPFPGTPFLPLGPPGSFDRRQIRTASSLVELDDRILLLYAGSPHPHVAAHQFDIGLATLRLDGVAAITAAEQEGSLLSKPLQFDAGRLLVNARVAPNGYVKAAVLDAEQGVLPGFEPAHCHPFTGDSLRAELAWDGKKGLPAAPKEGRRLRFLLKNAQLFSFSIVP
jgi:hypothetical protein